MLPAIINSKFDPRDYQREVLDAMFIKEYKRLLVVWHRRAGKDHMGINLVHCAALIRPGLYFYLLPTNGQANSVIWEGRGKDGLAFLDYIPKPLIKKKSEVTKRITLSNGSIICVTGSNNYEVLIGSNPLGIVLSEVQSSDPDCINYLRPVLAENDGWLMGIGTCRGRHNILYDLYSKNLNNPEWYVTVKTANDTHDNEGNPVITQAHIEAEIQAGMPRALVDQEFYCSWDGFVENAYFTEEMQKMHADGRVCELDVHPHLPVYTAWDLGWNDSTAIALFQIYPDGSIRCIHYIENKFKPLHWYVDELANLQSRYGFRAYARHILPHDVNVTELGTGRTRREQLRGMGVTNIVVAPKVSVPEKIQCLRVLLNRVWMKQSTTQKLFMSLVEYHADTNKHGEDIKPAHDWSSHAVDAICYFAVSYLDSYERSTYNTVRQYAKRKI